VTIVIGVGGIGGIFGLFGIACGILVIIGAAMMYVRPEQHVPWSIVILVFTILGVLSTLGGLVIGLIPGLMGGILGLVWKPSVPASPAPSPPKLTIRACTNCGREIAPDVKFCPHCGKGSRIRNRTGLVTKI